MLKVPFELYGGSRSDAHGYAEAVRDYSSCCYMIPSVTGKVLTGMFRKRGEAACGCVGDCISDGRAFVRALRMERHPSRDGVYLGVCKLVFWAFWLGLVVLEAAALWGTAVPLLPKIYLIAVMVLATLLNGSSYFLCCIYVWFLNRLSDMEGLGGLPYNRHAPIRTLEYRKLSDVAKGNTVAFLLIALQFSAAMLLDCLLLPGDSPTGLVQMLCFLAVVVVGFVTFVVLFQCSRMFLDRILDRWRGESLEEIERLRREDPGLRFGNLVATAARESWYLKARSMVELDEKMGKVDFLTLMLAAMSLAVNVGTFVLALLKGD